MKTPIAVTLIVAGAALVVAPIVKSQLQLQRVVEHYEQHGEGTQVPEELRPRPYGAYDWACMAAGAILSFMGTRGSVRTALPAAVVRSDSPATPLAKA